MCSGLGTAQGCTARNLLQPHPTKPALTALCLCSRLAHAHLLPNHLEVSYHNDSFIFLWPPMESFLPALFNPGHMMRYLKPHYKRKRVSKSTKLQKVRCSLGWRRKKPYLKQRVFAPPTVPPTLKL